MKKANFIWFVAAILFFISPVANGQINQKSISYQVYSSSIYYPGDKPTVNLYAYSYNEKEFTKQKFEFEVKVYRIKNPAEFFINQTSQYAIDVLGNDSTNLLYLCEEVNSFTKTLKPTKDYYYYINESFSAGVYETGAYVVKVSLGEYVAYTGFIISSYGVMTKSGVNTVLAYVVDRKTGEPVSDAYLEYYYNGGKVASGNTQKGVFYSLFDNEVKGKSKQNYPLFIGKKGNEIIVSDAYGYYGYSSGRYNAYMYTNQPVYRTTSEVLFKGYLKKKEISGYSSVADKKLTLKITDAKGAEVLNETKMTNELGSFDGSFKIPEDSPLGTYYITATTEDNNAFSCAFDVEQFKKPEYKVEVKTDRSQYFGKDEIKATVQADYFFGSPVTDAAVEYNIYKVRYYTPWWKFSEYAWWYEEYYEQYYDNYNMNSSVMIYSGKGTLDKDGKFELSYTINENFKYEKQNYYDYWWYGNGETDYKYIVQAKVVDKSRREISGMASAFVTRGGFYLNVKADKYFYKPGESMYFDVRSQDFAEKLIQTKFKASIYRVDWGRNYENRTRELIKTIDGETKYDGKAIAEYKSETNLKAGYYEVEVKASDERGNEIKASDNFYVSGEDYSWWYNDGSNSAQIVTDKDSYKKGDVCKVLIYLPKPGANVLITAQSENVMFYKVEKFYGNMISVEIPIDEKYNSNFEIDVNYVFENQFYSSAKHVFVVPEDKFLTVEVTPSKEIYKPKEDGTMKVKVLDINGKPVKNAEVSLGIIDESIYYVKPDKTADIRKAFYGMSTGYLYTLYNYNKTYYGYSRMITIFERFNIKSIKEGELGTVKGVLYDKDGNKFANAYIMIDGNYYAGSTGEDGDFEFNLPEGKYTIGLFLGGGETEDLSEIRITKGGTVNLQLKSKSEIKNYQQEITLNSGDISDQVQTLDGRVTTEAPVSVKSSEKKEVMKKDGKGRDEDKQLSKDEGKLVEPDVRSDFRDAILWMPYVRTDENGYAEVNVKYPDNLTEWRLTAKVMTEDTKVGQTIAKVITRKNLLVRMETPRFLQQNDKVNITTIVHNYLSTAKDVTVRFKATGVTYAGDLEKKLTINPGEDKSLDWEVNVTEPNGNAVLYCEALTNEESDAVEQKVPLQPRGMEVIKTLSADITDMSKTEIKNIHVPYAADLKSTYYKVNVSPSIASALLSSLDELIGYPYGCVEQTMSRFLPSVIVMNAFKDLNAPVSDKSKTELPKMVDAGVKRLLSFQHSDGGWGWWTNDQSNPYMTAYVIYGLSIANQSGYKLKSGVVNNGLKFLKGELNKEIDLTTRAYILYVMSITGGKDYNKIADEEALKLASDTKLNDFGHSLLAMAFYNTKNSSAAAKEISTLTVNAKTFGDDAAYWEGTSFHYNWQDDKVQTTAMALKAFVNNDPNNPIIGKIIRWLLNQRHGFSWNNTQETALIVYSMVDYLKISKELEPGFVAKVYLNGEEIYQKAYTKDDVYKKDSVIKIPGNKLKIGDNEIKIEKSGSGKLYYSSSLVYFDNQLPIKPGENGFRVEKEYYKLEKYEYYNEQKIEYKKKYFDGTVNSGDLILVKIKVYSKDKNLSYFLLEDPLPSGCEVMKDDWQYKIQDENNYAGYPYYYWRWWYADKDIWDNRISFFATYMYGDEQEFSYILRAQIPGEYSINPTKAMLMYYTDVNGNTGDSKLVIK